MSDSPFANPKVALGFAGVVVAAALIASVAFQQFTPGEQASQPATSEATATAQAPAQQAPGGLAQQGATGWAGDAGVSDDWGAPVQSAQNGGFSGVAEQTNDAPVFGDHVSRTVSGGGYDRSSGPKITTSAAPGAPKVVPPSRGARPQIAVTDN